MIKKNDQKIYVLDFKGDVQASAVDTIREEITLIWNCGPYSSIDCNVI